METRGRVAAYQNDYIGMVYSSKIHKIRSPADGYRLLAMAVIETAEHDAHLKHAPRKDAMDARIFLLCGGRWYQTLKALAVSDD